jgi:hypothetical protein
VAELVQAVVDRQLAAYRDRDLARFLACYSPSITIRDFAGTVLMEGHEAMQSQYGPLFRDSPDLRVEVPRRIVSGEYVIDVEQVSGFNVAGLPREIHAVVVYRVQGAFIQDVVLLT